MIRRDVLLVLISVSVGPLIASVVFCIVGSIAAGVLFGSRLALLQYLAVVVMAGYAFGAVPGLIGSLVVAVLSRCLPKFGTRLLLGSIVGAVSSLPIVVLLSSWQNVFLMLAVCPGGAIAGLVCVGLVEWMDPLPAKARVVT